MTTRRKPFPPHKHLWQDRYTRDWRYECRVCGKKSRNRLTQDVAFREPLRLTSTHWDFTTGRVTVTHSTLEPRQEPTATCDDCGAAIAPGTRFCPASDEAGCTERAFVRNGGAALCAQAAAARRAGKEHE